MSSRDFFAVAIEGFGSHFAGSDDLVELSVSGSLCPELEKTNVFYDEGANGRYGVPLKNDCEVLRFEMESVPGFIEGERVSIGTERSGNVVSGALRFDNLVRRVAYPYLFMKFDLGRDVVSGVSCPDSAPIDDSVVKEVRGQLSMERMNDGRGGPKFIYRDKPSVMEGVNIFWDAVFGGERLRLKNDKRVAG